MPTFLLGNLLWGVLAGSIPVIVHLICREKPKQMPFPAVRFIRRSAKVSVSRSRLKHLILLAMRVLAIVLLVVALARPRLASNPLAGLGGGMDRVIIVDDSYTMGFIGSTGSRFEVARAAAADFIDDLAPGSGVCVIAASAEQLEITRDLPAARGSIDRLTLSDKAADLAESVTRAGRLLEEAAREGVAGRARDVIVITDMIGRWGLRGGVELLPDVAVHVYDVGEDNCRNLYFQDFTVRTPYLRADSPMLLAATLRASPAAGGEKGLRAALMIGGKKVADYPAAIPATEGGTEVSFNYVIKKKGIVSGRVTLLDSDSLPADDAVCFTLLLTDRPHVLLVGRKEADGSFDPAARLVERFLSPQQVVATKLVSPQDEVPEDLADYDVVVLVDVPGLQPEGWRQITWERLKAFVRGGGGLVTYLGPHLDPANYNAWGAANCLPVASVSMHGEIAKQGAVHVRLDVPTAQLFAKFNEPTLYLTAPLFRIAVPVEKSPDARVLASFDLGSVERAAAHERPWILEQTFGGGRSVLLTSGWAKDWNDLFSPSSLNIAFVFQHEMIRYAREGSSRLLNCTVGDAVSIYGDYNPATGADIYPHDGSIPVKFKGPTYTETSKAGNYLVTESNEPQRVLWGFSANLDAADSKMERLAMDDLKPVFPEGVWKNVSLARTVQEVKSNAARAYGALEMYPYLMMLLLAIVSVESFLANRFYRR